ncbi:hypothetical protein NDK43_07210 [Neobacillus pocheonensis]|uniref:Uncharacterized protein n=1 Tax=Neobacillus pocheonensis TaxID=363869 RepID=A0ABT0W7D1_9BACI|nr:hypothetical protein [Neobacillus pocheonensis]
MVYKMVTPVKDVEKIVKPITKESIVPNIGKPKLEIKEVGKIFKTKKGRNDSTGKNLFFH